MARARYLMTNRNGIVKREGPRGMTVHDVSFIDGRVTVDGEPFRFVIANPLSCEVARLLSLWNYADLRLSCPDCDGDMRQEAHEDDGYIEWVCGGQTCTCSECGDEHETEGCGERVYTNLFGDEIDYADIATSR